MSDDEAAYEMVLPFLPVKSKGGPHDDDAYTAGFEMGQLHAGLDQLKDGIIGTPEPLSAAIREENAPQADLIAMHHGYTAEFGEPSGGWVLMELVPGGEL